jgi:inhibitor of KinA sporulation pathway (predicted exonuclease)
MRCIVNCYVSYNTNSKFPENTFYCNSLEEINKILANAAGDISGIEKVEIWFNKPSNKKRNLNE